MGGFASFAGVRGTAKGEFVSSHHELNVQHFLFPAALSFFPPSLMPILFFQDGGTALLAACQNGHMTVVETLLKHGANIHDQLYVSFLKVDICDLDPPFSLKGEKFREPLPRIKYF